MEGAMLIVDVVSINPASSESTNRGRLFGFPVSGSISMLESVIFTSVQTGEPH